MPNMGSAMGMGMGSMGGMALPMAYPHHANPYMFAAQNFPEPASAFQTQAQGGCSAAPLSSACKEKLFEIDNAHPKKYTPFLIAGYLYFNKVQMVKTLISQEFRYLNIMLKFNNLIKIKVHGKNKVKIKVQN